MTVDGRDARPTARRPSHWDTAHVSFLSSSPSRPSRSHSLPFSVCFVFPPRPPRSSFTTETLRTQRKKEIWIPTFVGMTRGMGSTIVGMTVDGRDARPTARRPSHCEMPVPLRDARSTGIQRMFRSFLRVLRALRVHILCLPPRSLRSLRGLRVRLSPQRH